MNEKPIAIMTPGIGPLPWAYKGLASTFEMSGVEMEFFPVEWWSDEKNKFIEIQNRFFDRIDKLYNGRDRISLLGISAGGPFALEALVSLEGMIRNVVTVAGCNSPKNKDNNEAYEKLYEGNKVFREMIEGFGETRDLLDNRNDLSKKATTYVVVGDDVVPYKSQSFDGAKLIDLKTVKLPFLTRHESSIVRGMILKRGEVASFLKK